MSTIWKKLCVISCVAMLVIACGDNSSSDSTTNLVVDPGPQAIVIEDPIPPSGDDYDGDGIPNSEDPCPESDMSEFLSIAGCDLGILNVLDESGCTLADRFAECGELTFKNHGKWVVCIERIAKQLKKEGLISGKEKGMIVKCAARADIP